MLFGKQKGAARKEKALKSAYIAALRAIDSGADGRSRTGMEVIRRILSAVRLPIPPHRQVYFNSLSIIQLWKLEGYGGGILKNIQAI